MRGAVIGEGPSSGVLGVFGGTSSGVGRKTTRSRKCEGGTLNTTGDVSAGRFRREDMADTCSGGIMVDMLGRMSGNDSQVQVSPTHTMGCVSDVCQCGCGLIVAGRSSLVWGMTIDVEMAADSCSRRSTTDERSEPLAGTTSASPPRGIQVGFRLTDSFRGRLCGHQADCSAQRV